LRLLILDKKPDTALDDLFGGFNLKIEDTKNDSQQDVKMIEK
jgi:hypothetical protein